MPPVLPAHSLSAASNRPPLGRRTVRTFAGEPLERRRYESHVAQALASGEALAGARCAPCSALYCIPPTQLPGINTSGACSFVHAATARCTALRRSLATPQLAVWMQGAAGGSEPRRGARFPAGAVRPWRWEQTLGRSKPAGRTPSLCPPPPPHAAPAVPTARLQAISCPAAACRCAAWRPPCHSPGHSCTHARACCRYEWGEGPTVRGGACLLQLIPFLSGFRGWVPMHSWLSQVCAEEATPLCRRLPTGGWWWRRCGGCRRRSRRCRQTPICAQEGGQLGSAAAAARRGCGVGSRRTGLQRGQAGRVQRSWQRPGRETWS